MTFRCGTVGRKLVLAMSLANDDDSFRAGGPRRRAGGISARQPARFPRRCACSDSSERGRAVLTWVEGGGTTFRTRLRARRPQGRLPELSFQPAPRLSAGVDCRRSPRRQQRARIDAKATVSGRLSADVAHPNVAVHIGVVLHQVNTAIPRPPMNRVH
jgi:hypothetical protein